jgi:NAD(P)-dependent dehydrogenase (short-subunit alcohol dehydrogenase family)
LLAKQKLGAWIPSLAHSQRLRNTREGAKRIVTVAYVTMSNNRLHITASCSRVRPAPQKQQNNKTTKTIKSIVAFHQRLDILIANAGITHSAPFADWSADTGLVPQFQVYGDGLLNRERTLSLDPVRQTKDRSPRS